MHQIHIAAGLTTILALLMMGSLIRQLAPRANHRSLAILLIAGLMMSPLAYYCLRIPVLSFVEQTFKADDWNQPPELYWRDALRLSYAPLTEEPAKLLPWCVLLATGIRIVPSRRMAVPIAMTIGLSFAMGEIWLVAAFVARDPKMAEIPWYQFGGFVSERLMTCVTHGQFALPAVWCARRGVLAGAFGMFCGMLMHYVGNAPIVLMQREAFGISAATWSLVVQMWLVLFVVVALSCFVATHYGRRMLLRIWNGKAICPGCHLIYRQPLFLAFNAGASRYERCPHCRKWHWVSIKDLAPLESATRSGPEAQEGHNSPTSI